MSVWNRINGDRVTESLPVVIYNPPMVGEVIKTNSLGDEGLSQPKCTPLPGGGAVERVEGFVPSLCH